MSEPKRLFNEAKRAISTGLIAVTLLNSPADGNYQSNYRMNAPDTVLQNASPLPYNPTPADIAVDEAIMARDTLMYSEAWATILNAKFDDTINLPWDNGYEGFVKWRDNGIQKPTVYVERQAPIGVVIGAHEVPAEREINKFTTEYTAVCAPKDFGVLMYKANDVKFFVERFLKSEEYRQLDSFLKGKGLEPKYDIEYYASGFLPKEAEAGVTPYVSDGIKIFAFASDIGDKLRIEAKNYDVSLRNVVVNALMHELCHIYGIKGTPAGEERLEKLLVEFYDTQLNGHIGSTTNTGYGRDSVLLHIWKNYYEGKKISSSRKDVVRDIYTELGKSRSIDEVVSSLEKAGLGEKEIADFISRYSSETKSAKTEYKASKGEGKSSKYDEKSEDYNARAENNNSENSGEKSTDGESSESSDGESSESGSEGDGGGE